MSTCVLVIHELIPEACEVYVISEELVTPGIRAALEAWDTHALNGDLDLTKNEAHVELLYQTLFGPDEPEGFIRCQRADPLPMNLSISRIYRIAEVL